MHKKSAAIIAGIDEAGRGCLAGPVVAAACIFDRTMFKKQKLPLITDSKQMTAEEREEAFTFLTKHCAYGVGEADAPTVDSIGILGATEKAMQRALAALMQIKIPTYLLIDGRDHFWFDIPHSSIIRGDESEDAIAAASVLAKVTRDRLMVSYDAKFPEFGFAEHKGYGTPFHFEILQRNGPCPLHRMTFLRRMRSVPV